MQSKTKSKDAGKLSKKSLDRIRRYIFKRRNKWNMKNQM